MLEVIHLTTLRPTLQVVSWQVTMLSILHITQLVQVAQIIVGCILVR